MSVNMQSNVGQNSVRTVGRNSPVPGLGLSADANEVPPSSEEGRDFASVMRDVPQPAARNSMVQAEPAKKDFEPEVQIAAASLRAERKVQRTADMADSVPSQGDTINVTGEEHARKAPEKAEKKTARANDHIDPSPDGVAVAAFVAVPVADNAIVAVESGKSQSDKEQGKAVAVTAPPAAGKNATAVDSAPVKSEVASASKQVLPPSPVVEGEAPDAVPVPAEKQVASNTRSASQIRSEGKKDADDSSKIAHEHQNPVPVDKAAAPKAGEATALLSIVKEKITTPSGTPASGIFGKAADKGDVVDSDTQTPRKGDAAPRIAKDIATPQSKIIAGLQVATERAAPDSAVVARVAALSVPEMPAKASVRGVEGAQVSALAIAAAQTSETSHHGTKNEGGKNRDSSAPIGSGLFSDATATKEAVPGPAHAVTRYDAPTNTIPVAPPPGIAPVAGAVNLAGALDQQVVDLGVSGQWINDIAREIASMGANPGQGSFRIASQALGAVRVDITPGAQGSDIVMTVDNEAAQSALMNDRQRLVQDAQTASVRIGDVRIDRVAAPGHTQSGDMGNGGQGQGANSQSGAQQGALSQNGGQNSGQSGGQNTRHDMANLAGQGQNGNNPKASFTRTVLGETHSGEMPPSPSGRRGDVARYA